MNTVANRLLALSCSFLLIACAAPGPVDPTKEGRRSEALVMSEIRAELGCSEDQALVCIETNCRPENYACADERDIRRMFEIRTKQW